MTVEKAVWYCPLVGTVKRAEYLEAKAGGLHAEPMKTDAD